MGDKLLEAYDLKKYYPLRRGLLDVIRGHGARYLRAVDGVSFHIEKGEVFCLVGESGCGKTTTGRLVLRLIEPTSGKVLFRGEDITSAGDEELGWFRRKAQIIFQDPYESLNPHMRIYDIVTEPLYIHGELTTREERIDAASKLLTEVSLVPPEEFVYRYPHELSGGQRQRVAIARALSLRPEFIVADEPVSMLDMSIRAEILQLMLGIREKFNISYLFITHDLAVARIICDRVAIMYLGKIVEEGPAEQVITNPMHPYTRALISAVPLPDPRHKIGEIPIKGEVPSPVNIPSGCRFHPRCPFATDKCRAEEPPAVEVEPGHFVRCWLHG
ncbi:ABC transporter ATP-binding protein [Infirmifilum sp. SLHALR2]|nr:MAG: oligopeptide ABC transporter ATP-binding protein [Thermofilum sp. NZ13]